MNNNINKTLPMGRRDALKAVGAGALALGFASTAHATPESAAKALSDATGGAAATAGSAKVTLDVPEMAENGAMVPVTVKVDSPMTDADHVTQIHIYGDGNPNPQIIGFKLTPNIAKAEVSTRVRLSKTQNVIAGVVMSDGTVHTQKKTVKVTIGGCAG